jgi:hypothetical protein
MSLAGRWGGFYSPACKLQKDRNPSAGQAVKSKKTTASADNRALEQIDLGVSFSLTMWCLLQNIRLSG